MDSEQLLLIKLCEQNYNKKKLGLNIHSRKKNCWNKIKMKQKKTQQKIDGKTNENLKKMFVF